MDKTHLGWKNDAPWLLFVTLPKVLQDMGCGVRSLQYFVYAAVGVCLEVSHTNKNIGLKLLQTSIMQQIDPSLNRSWVLNCFAYVL